VEDREAEGWVHASIREAYGRKGHQAQKKKGNPLGKERTLLGLGCLEPDLSITTSQLKGKGEKQGLASSAPYALRGTCYSKKG